MEKKGKTREIKRERDEDSTEQAIHARLIFYFIIFFLL